MKVKRGDVVIGCLALVLTLALWFNVAHIDTSLHEPLRAPAAAMVTSETDVAEEKAREVLRSLPKVVEPERAALQAVAPAEAGYAPISDELNSPESTAAGDLAVVLNLFGQYRKRFDGYPSGEDNAAFVNALAGNNPARMAFIDRSNPAIDAQGQLCDRWGTPYFFHLLSREALEVRTAGPDREMYTPDDVIVESPVLKAERIASSP